MRARSYYALRQYIEYVSETQATKTSKTKLWQLEIHRASLCADVLSAFGNFSKLKLWQRTNVTFLTSSGEEEDGVDEGGLTVEM